jgi:signal transduction histidine kinase
MAEAGRGAAVDGVTRTMALALGVAAVLLSIVALPSFLVQHGVAHPVWTWAVAIGMFVPPLAGAVLAPWVPTRVLRAFAASAAVAQLVGLVLLVPALPGGSLSGQYGTPWLLAVTATGTTAAAVAWRTGPALGYLGATVVLLGLDRYLALPSPNPQLALQDALYALLFDVVFVALALTTRRAGHRLDAAADAAAAETRVAAAAAARRRERTRVEALLHDNVLVALLASSRGSERAAAQARSALDELVELETVRDDEAHLDDTTWVWRLQALTTDLAPGARFSHELHPTDDDGIPAEAGRALLEATAEAVRNSIQHAGSASRAVHARISDELVEVTVLDDGSGFDPGDLPPGRLGLTVSIFERMRGLPGGGAAVVSRPGVGTRVSLTWRRAA